MCGFDDCFQLLQAVLPERWIITLGDNAPGGHDFDYVGAVFDVLADFLNRLGNSIDDPSFEKANSGAR